MANRYAVASGNWSNTATWDGGTLPQAGDVVRPNGFTVAINQDINVTELINNASAPAVAGGSFSVGSGRTITANIIHRNLTGTSFLSANYGGGTSTINGNVILFGSFSSANNSVVAVSGLANGQLVINGDVYMNGPTGTNEAGGVIKLNGNGFGFRIICNGLVSGALNWTGPVGFEGDSNGVMIDGQNYVIELNGVTQGRVVASSTRVSNGVRIFNASTSNTIINNGVIQGGIAINENTGDAVLMPINLSNQLRNYGTIMASGTQRGVNGGLVIHYEGSVVSDNFQQVAMSPKAQRIDSSFVNARINIPLTSLTNVAFRTAGLLTGYPLESKVEDGTVYGPSSEFEGTLEPWDAAFAQALATAQRDLQLPSILSAITQP